MYFLMRAQESLLDIDESIGQYELSLVEFLVNHAILSYKTIEYTSYKREAELYRSYQLTVIQHMKNMVSMPTYTPIGIFYILNLKGHYLTWHSTPTRRDSTIYQQYLYNTLTRALDLTGETTHVC